MTSLHYRAQPQLARAFMNTPKRSFASQTADGMHITKSTAGKSLVVIALGVLLYVAHEAFIPIALALLFALILSGPVEALHKLKVPRGISAAVILIILLAAIAGL